MIITSPPACISHLRIAHCLLLFWFATFSFGNTPFSPPSRRRSRLDTVLLPIRLHSRHLLVSSLTLQPLGNVSHFDDGDDGDPEFLFDLLHRTLGPRAPLLSIQSNDQSNYAASLGLNDIVGLSNGGAGSDDIVDNENALLLERGADNGAPLSMSLGLFTIVGVPNVTATSASQFGCDGRYEGNTLVGWTKEDLRSDGGGGGLFSAVG